MRIKALFLGLLLGFSTTVLASQPAYPELEQSYDTSLHDRLSLIHISEPTRPY